MSVLVQMFFNPLKETLVPEHYFKAAGELLGLGFLVSWTITAAWRPDVVAKNPLLDRIGYNNACVGFDMPPAKYVMVPFMVTMCYCGIRYCFLDSQRAVLERQRLTASQYLLTWTANIMYGLTFTFVPMLLVLTPDVDANGHTFIFQVIIVTRWLCVAANFYQAKTISFSQRLWFICYTVSSLLLPTLITIDFVNYNIAKGGRQQPTIPAIVTQAVDYTWFVLLFLTNKMLPDSPPICVKYRLATPEQLAEQGQAATEMSGRAEGEKQEDDADAHEKKTLLSPPAAPPGNGVRRRSRE